MIYPTVPPHDHDDLPPAPPLPTVDELIRQCPTFSPLDAAFAITFVEMRVSDPHGRNAHMSNIIDYSQQGYTWQQIWMVLLTEWRYWKDTGDYRLMLDDGDLVHSTRHSLQPTQQD